MNDATVDELLAAYALHACDPAEAEWVEQYVTEHPRAAAELARLSTAASWIGATEALTPPPELRAGVLAAARSRRRPDEPDETLDLFRDQTDQLESLVRALRPADLSGMTENGLSVRDLVIHSAAMETMVAASLRHASPPIFASVDVEERTAAFVEAFAVSPLDEVRALWRESVDQVVAWARSGVTEGLVPWLQITLARDTILIIRAFETWVHANDIRRVLGRELESPVATHLHRMAEFSMQSLPAWLEISGRSHPGRAARIVLTGAGGGSWLVPLALGETGVSEADRVGAADRVDAVDVVIEADVIDWCHRVTERNTTETIAVRVSGGADATDLAVDILDSASALARL